MNNESLLEDLGDGNFKLTKRGSEICVKLVEGATPSELGLELGAAFFILAGFTIVLGDRLKTEEAQLNPEFKRAIEEYIEKAKNLANIFKEASQLSGEL